ncbi:MAG TPA: AarF/ABC1/UbiB kinase family protein [Chloroflexota bacterium]|nr:AarF/ABC1/UbiB kinase family protein [Chloroflexota bacterium]
MTSSAVNPRRRTRRILRLFFSLFFGFFLQYARARLTGRRYDFFEDEAANRKRAIKLRKAALEMGGVLIKVGQFLSARVDLLPAEYIEELALLQDEVPAVPFSEIRPILEADLGPLDSAFAHFDQEPVAAASLGQVYHARLSAGEQVAVKVQRPHIDEIVEADLSALRLIIHWLDRYTPVRRRADLPLILREFEDTLRLELDYHAEGHHAERLAILFHDSHSILIPRVYWSHSHGRVLTLQYMTGIKITDFAAIEAEGISRALVAEILLIGYLKQVVEDGFFHADPHPGNLLVRPGPQVVLLDFGMVGDISPTMRNNLRRVFLGVVRHDYDEILSALERLGFIPMRADRSILREALVWTIETFYEMSFAELQAVDPTQVLDRLQDVFYTESVRIPANYAFLGRALGTLSGICTALDPSFQFMTVAEPFARRLLQGRAGLRGTIEQAVTEAGRVARTAYSLPFLTAGALDKVQSGELAFRHELADMVFAVDRVERALRRLFFGLLIAAFLLVGAFFFPTHHQLFGILAFAVCVILLEFVILTFRDRPRRP